MKQLDNQTTTPAELFIDYCDNNFGKSQGNLTQFERFASYWEIFKFAYFEGWTTGHINGLEMGYKDGQESKEDNSNYEEGYEEGFKAGYRKAEVDTEKEMNLACKEAYQQGLFEGCQNYYD